MRSVIRTASDDSCGGGLGTRLQVMHEKSPHLPICSCKKLVTFELIKKKVEFSAVSDAAGPEEQ